jgi:DNA/RNA-binding domain of Phe-tRNA-synthetase-like protein
MLTITEKWNTTYPGASVGVLIMADVSNPKSHPEFAAQKADVEEGLRTKYADLDRAALRQLPTLGAYHAFYKGFKKTYHVQLQLESIVHKGRSIPNVATLVEAMFTAELKNQLLTAGHDLDIVQQPVGIYVAEGDETYVRLNGQEQQLKAGDMYIADAEGILSSVIYGPDKRTPITAQTTRALFTIYAPPGIDPEVVRMHMGDIEDYAKLISPNATTEQLEVFTA